ncbi:MAG: biopolymer transporter ExbD [SAR324 cluster bacterium]|nr:biopolymer transporter ExbD [SAR324 cluster bacterium]MCZ6533101.1 biopolymer transporter ExbD [SAR324 cluster bacterium]
MRIKTGYENRRARIELLPMIDVVFLLLVFFIYAMLSMVTHRGLRVELPASATAQVDKRRFLSITITAGNRILLQEAVVRLDDLAGRVLAMKRREEDLAVFIRGDAHADLGVALEVLDRLRAAGIHEVSFEAQGRIK